jgi:hypothetical protein
MNPMNQAWCRGLSGLIVMLSLAAAVPASAVEYRLRVVSVEDKAMGAFLTAGEFNDGATGPGLRKLEAALDGGDLSRAVLFHDRHLQRAGDRIARAHGAVAVQVDVQTGGHEGQLWDEVRWEGKPGEQTVWPVIPVSTITQEVQRVALKGTGPLRQFRSYTIPSRGPKVSAVKFPLPFLWFHEDRGGVWETYVSKVLDLGDGIGAVVGVNHNEVFADHVYLIVRHAAEPTTYKAVIVWNGRKINRNYLEGPGCCVQ